MTKKNYSSLSSSTQPRRCRGSTSKLNTEIFIQRSVAVHGDSYDYSNSVYKNCATNVEIMCKSCGKTFHQLPPNHWMGYRCTHCYSNSSNAESKFITNARKCHGSRYDYSLVKYKNNRVGVDIICKHHGVFNQAPSSHTKGHGCPSCAGEKSSLRQRMSFTEFRDRSMLTHNNKYQYNEESFDGLGGKIGIKCPVHGWFEQNGKAHLHGKGCRLCGFDSSGYNRTRFQKVCDKNNNGNGVLYLIECTGNNEAFYKIGITSRTVKKRFMSKGHLPYEFTELHSIEGDASCIYNLENKMHSLLKSYRYRPNIEFKGSAYECFSEITTEIIELFTAQMYKG